MSAAPVPTARPFTHREDGTDEPTWLLNGRWDDVPRLPTDEVLLRCDRVVLVAPHPDDETLALGAFLADCASKDVAVTVVVATHGGAGAGATVRRREGERAIAELGASVTQIWWDLPDGGLANVEEQLQSGIAALVDERTLLLAPVECDGHTDHEAVARAAEDAARRQSAELLFYPIWFWHWATPEDVDWSRFRTIAPSLDALQSKSAAIDCYRSQLTADDGSPIVGASVLARAHRVMETVLLPAEAAGPPRKGVTESRSRSDVAGAFDAMYGGGDTDPWKLDSSVYERRRLELISACLGRPRYGRVLEIGCATGQLSQLLATRADEVVGLDASERALAVARERTDAVRWVLGAAPRDIPEERFDLVVLSEVGYFLDGPDLIATLRAVRRNLAPNGEIVVANWRRPTEHIALDGPSVNRQAASALDLPLRARYEDADLSVDVWGEPVSVYDEYRGAL